MNFIKCSRLGVQTKNFYYNNPAINLSHVLTIVKCKFEFDKTNFHFYSIEFYMIDEGFVYWAFELESHRDESYYKLITKFEEV